MSVGCRQRGFSLIEVVLAIGIFSFAVIGILGLMTMSIKESAQAKRDTVIASMLKRVVSDLERTIKNDPQNIKTPLFFSYAGETDSDDPGGPQIAAKDRYYRCDIRLIAPTTPWSAEDLPLQYVIVEFRWPEGAAQQEKETFEATFPF